MLHSQHEVTGIYSVALTPFKLYCTSMHLLYGKSMLSESTENRPMQLPVPDSTQLAKYFNCGWSWEMLRLMGKFADRIRALKRYDDSGN